MHSDINIPNSLSFLRILLTPVFLYFSFTKQTSIAFILLFIAGLTDWADGYAARRFNQTSKLGEVLDPIADKILLVASYIGFYILGPVPFWLMMGVVGRDILLVFAGVFILRRNLSASMSPSRISKINTVLQISHIALILLYAPNLITTITGWIVMITTCASGFAYAYHFYTWYTQKK